LTPIVNRRFSANQLVRDKAIHQADGTVMADLQTLSKFADAGRFPSWKAFDCQKRLVVLCRNSGGIRSSLAKMQKATQRVAEGRQELVLMFGELRLHGAESGCD
jgi:hypothetical protein